MVLSPPPPRGSSAMGFLPGEGLPYGIPSWGTFAMPYGIISGGGQSAMVFVPLLRNVCVGGGGDLL